jgi:hypothetical protein
MHECKVIIKVIAWSCFLSTSSYFRSIATPQLKMHSTLPATRCPHQFRHVTFKHQSLIN